MDANEGHEFLSKYSNLRSTIQAVAFSYDWDAHKISQQIARAWREGRVVDNMSSIMDECENSGINLGKDSDNATSVLLLSASDGAQNGEISGSLDGASFSSAPLLGMAASFPTADVTDKVPTDCVSEDVPVAEANDNAHVVVSDNWPSVASNIEASDSAVNDRACSNAQSAAGSSRASFAYSASSAEPSLHQEQVRALQNENRLLVKQIMCIYCSTAERDSLFMPCGHFIMCSSCSDKCSVCPLCNVTVLATSRTRL